MSPLSEGPTPSSSSEPEEPVDTGAAVDEVMAPVVDDEVVETETPAAVEEVMAPVVDEVVETETPANGHRPVSTSERADADVDARSDEPHFNHSGRPMIMHAPRPTEKKSPGTQRAPDEIIRTEGLTKIYESDDGEKLTALDHLDLSVCKGEIFGLLGPNGAGKTTTVGMLTTRVIPTSGTAIVGGVDVVAEPARAKHAIGVVHQANTLDRSLTVSENLYFHARYFGMNATAATVASEAALERFRLGARRKAEVRTLSGGMARRLMVARAILHHPAVLFLDEPTAGLDPQSRLALWDIVGELHDDGQTIMLTTHYMEEADRFCNRVAIVDHGRILALDTPTNLKHSADLRHDTASAAKAKLARFRALARVVEPAELEGIIERPEAEAVLLDPIVAPDTAEELFEGVTLESVFIELTGRDLRE